MTGFPLVLCRALVLGDTEATQGQNSGSPPPTTMPHFNCFMYFIRVLLEIMFERVAVAAIKEFARKFFEF